MPANNLPALSVFTFDNLMAAMVELFEEAAPSLKNYTKPDGDDELLFLLFTDQEFLTDWIVNSIEENYDEIVESFRNTLKDKELEEKIISYFKLLKSIHNQVDNLYTVLLVSEDSMLGFTKEKHLEQEAVKKIQNSVDWEKLTEEYKEELNKIELNFPNINFVGTWYTPY